MSARDWTYSSLMVPASCSLMVPVSSSMVPASSSMVFGQHPDRPGELRCCHRTTVEQRPAGVGVGGEHQHGLTRLRADVMRRPGGLRGLVPSALGAHDPVMRRGQIGSARSAALERGALLLEIVPGALIFSFGGDVARAEEEPSGFDRLTAGQEMLADLRIRPGPGGPGDLRVSRSRDRVQEGPLPPWFRDVGQ
jgi:hypothetical protein